MEATNEGRCADTTCCDIFDTLEAIPPYYYVSWEEVASEYPAPNLLAEALATRLQRFKTITGSYLPSLASCRVFFNNFTLYLSFDNVAYGGYRPTGRYGISS